MRWGGSMKSIEECIDIICTFPKLLYKKKTVLHEPFKRITSLLT